MRMKVFLICAFAASLVSVQAEAYVGPGAGIGALGAILGIIGAILMSIFVIALWPLRKLLRRKRNSAATASGDAEAQSR